MWTPLGRVIAELLPLAAGVALSSTALIAAVVIALGPHGARRGTALVVGRFLGIVLVVGAFAAMFELLKGVRGAPFVFDVLYVGVGSAMIALGVIAWIRRPRGAAALAPPKWLASASRLSTLSVFGLGFTLSAVNAKELAFGAEAGLVIGGSLREVAPTLVAVGVFATVGCLAAAFVVAVVAFGGERFRAALGRFRSWLERWSRTITAAVLVLFGVVLVANAFL